MWFCDMMWSPLWDSLIWHGMCYLTNVKCVSSWVTKCMSVSEYVCVYVSMWEFGGIREHKCILMWVCMYTCTHVCVHAPMCVLRAYVCIVEGVVFISFLPWKTNTNILWEPFSKETWHFCSETRPRCSILERKHGLHMARGIKCCPITCCDKTTNGFIASGMGVTFQEVGLFSAESEEWHELQFLLSIKVVTPLSSEHIFLLYYRREKGKVTCTPSPIWLLGSFTFITKERRTVSFFHSRHRNLV